MAEFKMKADKSVYGSCFFGSVSTFLRKIPFSTLAFGPIPSHIAFIMDGNRRYAKKHSTEPRDAYKAGFDVMIRILVCCFELGIKFVTFFALSMDNFKRDPEEVQGFMDLMEEKFEELLNDEMMLRKYGFKINFWGDPSLLTKSLRATAEKAMASTAGNTGAVLSFCIAYSSTSEIMHALNQSCNEKDEEFKRGGGGSGCHGDAGSLVSVEDLERHLYSAGCPDPDILIRTSGETRLSNFLLWQSTSCQLQAQVALWPEFSIWHLVWVILGYQRAYPHMEGLRSRAKKHF